MAADGVKLADVAPAEAAQERAPGGGGLHHVAQDASRPAGPQGVRVIDAVTTRERRHDERQELVARVRPTGRSPEVEVLLDEILETEVCGERGRQQESRVSHQAVVVEGRVEAVEAVR